MTKKMRPAYAVGRNLKMTPLQRIMDRTGKSPSECKCALCKLQCRTPCIGTPQDILRLIDAGYGSRLTVWTWPFGLVWGLIDFEVTMIQPKEENGFCTFFHDGLCELHDLGLKPTEGRLSHHTTKVETLKPAKSIGWAVVQEWLAPDNADVVKQIVKKLRKDMPL